MFSEIPGLATPARPPQKLWTFEAETFSPEECRTLIALMEDGPQKNATLVNGETESQIRRTAIHWLPEGPDTDWIYQRLARLVASANRDHFRYTLDGFQEDAQIARYQNGGFYDWHIDRGGRGPAGRARKLTIAIQLSPADAYEGGDLQLNPEGHVLTAPRDPGTAAVFPAFVLHRVTPVTAGARHSLVIWTHGPDFA